MRALVIALLGLVACDEAPTNTDTGAATLCSDAPQPVTWDNFGRSLLTERCQPCHATTVAGEDRRGAPDTVAFDDEEMAWMWSGAILGAATGDEPAMPPRGGLDEDDQYLLEVWLSCGG